MRSEFVLLSVSASQDRQTDVVLTLVEEKFIAPKGKGHERKGSFEEMFGSHRYVDEYFTTKLFMNYAEYSESGLKVGDRVTFQLIKCKPGRKMIENASKEVGEGQPCLFGSPNR